MASMGVNEGPLASVCDPLGATVPVNIKEKIVKSEYIELDLLLERHIPSPSSSFTLSLDNSGQLLLKDVKKRQQIISIMGWTDAFLIFSSVFVGVHPARAQEMFKYMHVIRMAAARFGGRGWMEYDRQFRMRQQLHPHRSWATIDGELWALFLSAPAAFYTGFGGQKGGGQVLPAKQRSFRTFPRNSGVCFAFNRGGCKNAQCRFSHKCSVCQSNDHGGATCKVQANKANGPRR